jgi:hypothetical protein
MPGGHVGDYDVGGVEGEVSGMSGREDGGERRGECEGKGKVSCGLSGKGRERVREG